MYNFLFDIQAILKTTIPKLQVTMKCQTWLVCCMISRTRSKNAFIKVLG